MSNLKRFESESMHIRLPDHIRRSVDRVKDQKAHLRSRNAAAIFVLEAGLEAIALADARKSERP
jgi:5,10-methylenetetrahydrofolate reductase